MTISFVTLFIINILCCVLFTIPLAVDDYKQNTSAKCGIIVSLVGIVLMTFIHVNFKGNIV